MDEVYSMFIWYFQYFICYYPKNNEIRDMFNSTLKYRKYNSVSPVASSQVVPSGKCSRWRIMEMGDPDWDKNYRSLFDIKCYIFGVIVDLWAL